MKKTGLFLALAALCLTFLTATAQEDCRVLFPSEIECQIVDGRDFYVIGVVPKDAKEAAVRLFNEEGDVVRALTGHDHPAFFLDLEGLSAFNTEQAEYFMPDLIYDPQNPESLYDGSIKCYVQGGMLFAVIPGGQYRMNGHAITDENGAPYAKLTPGRYTLEIEVGGQSARREMTLGAAEDKAMARFSPDGHFNSVTGAASENAIRTYLDPLPGYWSPSGFVPGQENNPYFAEIKDRWQLADGMEYAAGTVHFYIYNLTPTCATIAVELAVLQLDNAVDTRMKPYRYDIGEPLLAYKDAQSDVDLMGTFVPFEKGDRLALTRAQTGDAKENRFEAYLLEPRPVDLDLLDGVSAKPGETLTLFGVVTPIQNEAADLTRLTENAWEIGNRITHIQYEFSCEGETWSERRDVGLTRMLGENWEGYSLYEFAHCFTFPQTLSGKTVEASIQGYDVHGEKVSGTAEMLTIAVS